MPPPPQLHPRCMQGIPQCAQCTAGHVQALPPISQDRHRSLTEIHVFVLAHIVRRPIVVYSAGSCTALPGVDQLWPALLGACCAVLPCPGLSADRVATLEGDCRRIRAGPWTMCLLHHSMSPLLGGGSTGQPVVPDCFVSSAQLPSWQGPLPRGTLEGKGPQRRPQRRLGRRLEGVVKAVGGGYCRLQMPSRLAFGVRGTVAGHAPKAPKTKFSLNGPVPNAPEKMFRRPKRP